MPGNDGFTGETTTSWRTRWIRVWAWMQGHPAVSIPVAAFLVGILVGWWLL